MFKLLAVIILIFPLMSYADCRKSSDNSHVIIAKDALDQLEKIGLNRDGILAGMVETSVPESKGCWAGAAGDFDGQKVSVGIAQWNFGQVWRSRTSILIFARRI